MEIGFVLLGSDLRAEMDHEFGGREVKLLEHETKAVENVGVSVGGARCTSCIVRP